MAAVASGFCESNPGDQIKPHVESRALVAYDDNKLYIALIAWDNPRDVRASLCDRDKIFRDDYFGIMLDTYGDAAWGYEIFTNPLGIQGDLRMANGGNEDEGFDIVWESKGQVTDSGYQVEIAIPFASLRFPDKPEQTWRINFWRDQQRDVRRRFSWAAQDRNNPCFMCQWGTLTGIRDIKASTSFELLPTIVAHRSGSRIDGAWDAPFQNENPKADLSLNARYALSSNSSAEITLNPDFSQVESDATQIKVNSVEALYYPERRPFFQEGSDLYQTPIRAMHTRSINSPSVAGKFTGRFGRSSLGYFVARDRDGVVMIPNEEGSFVGENARPSTAQVFRFKQTFFDDSHVGLMVTDRRYKRGGSGTLVGGDMRFRFLRNYRIEAMGVATRTAEGEDTLPTSIDRKATQRTFERGRHTLGFDNETFWGNGAMLELTRSADVWSVDIVGTALSPTFRAEDGFVTRNDRRSVEAWSGLTFRPNKPWLRSWGPSLAAGRVWNYNGTRKDEWLVPRVQVVTNGQTEVAVEYVVSRELYSGVWFDGIRRLGVEVNSRFSRSAGVATSIEVGRTISRSLAAPVLGRSFEAYVEGSFKVSQRLRIEPSGQYSHMTYPDARKLVFEDYVVRSRFSYQFTREWFLRLVVEYSNFNEYYDWESTYHKDSYLTFEPLLSYKLNPFTIFYIGATNSHWDHERAGSMRRNVERFFTKFQYLFKI